MNIKGYRKNQKERASPTFKIVERKCCSTEPIHKFLNLTLSSQTLANIIEVFENTYHIDLYFTYRCREFFLHTLYQPCFAAEAYSEPLQTSKVQNTRFIRSYVNRPAVALTNHCQSYTVSLLDGPCSKFPCSTFLQLFVPSESAFALLSTPVARKLWTPRWVRSWTDVR